MDNVIFVNVDEGEKKVTKELRRFYKNVYKDALIYQQGNGHVGAGIKIEKYKNIWDMVCEIPYSNVELIVDGKYEQLKNNIYSRILDALENGSIINACRYYINNDWIGDICDRQEYIQVGAILEKYMKNKL